MSDSRRISVFKFLKVGQWQRTGRKHHAVMKKCTSKVSWSLHLRLSLWVCSEDAKKWQQKGRGLANVQNLLSDIRQHMQSSNCCPGLCWSHMIIGQMVERMHRSLKKKKRVEGWTEHWSQFYSTFSTFPESRSLYLKQVLPKPWRPELREVFESWKGKEKSRIEVGQHPEELDIGRERRKKRIQRSKWWWCCRGSKWTISGVRGVWFSSRGQAAVVKAFLCWIH